MWLFYCALEEEVLPAYYDICRWEDREGIDGRNSVLRRNFFMNYVLANFNDSSCKPASSIYPNLCNNFLEAILLYKTKEQKLPLLASGNVKDKLSDERCNVSFI